MSFFTYIQRPITLYTPNTIILDGDVYKTYEAWRADGRHVVKGQRSHLRGFAGVALFSIRQTAPTIPRMLYNNWDEEEDLWDALGSTGDLEF